MARASSTLELQVPADEVWRLIGGFGSLPDWLPAIPHLELTDGGRTRGFLITGGGAFVERLVAFDENERSYTYRIVQSPIPITDYSSTLRVSESKDGKGSRVDWWGEFFPSGVTDQAAEKVVQGIYDAGLAALANHFSEAGSAPTSASVG